MLYYKFFCQTIQCPKKEGGHNVPPSDVSPTKKHADVTRVKGRAKRIIETRIYQNIYIIILGYIIHTLL